MIPWLAPTLGRFTLDLYQKRPVDKHPGARQSGAGHIAFQGPVGFRSFWQWMALQAMSSPPTSDSPHRKAFSANRKSRRFDFDRVVEH